MSIIRTQHGRRRLIEAASAAALSTIVTFATQRAIALIMDKISKEPDWLIDAGIFSVSISLTAIAQASSIFRRWWIGFLVTIIGTLSYFLILMFTNASWGLDLDLGTARHWCLVFSLGAMFGGASWLLTTYQLQRSQPDERAVLSNAKPSKDDPFSNTLDYFDVVSNQSALPPAQLTQTTGGFVIFVRIDGITENPIVSSDKKTSRFIYKPLNTGQIYASVNILRDVMRGQYSSHSSPFGRFLLVGPSISETITEARRILHSTAISGVNVAIGITYLTQYQNTEDLDGGNVVGRGINLAARLAHIPDGAGKIAIDAHIERWIKDIPSNVKVGMREYKKVKKTRLEFHWLQEKPPTVEALAITEHKPETIRTVVVYDVVDFSSKGSIALGETAHKLNQVVKKALNRVTRDDIDHQKNQFSYAPGGDGGVLIFDKASQAWTFVEKVVLSASKQNLEIRVGITSGQVTFFDDGYPVGRGIYEADDLCALGKSEFGCICLSQHFWVDSLDEELPNSPRRRRTRYKTTIDETTWRTIYDRNLKCIILATYKSHFFQYIAIVSMFVVVVSLILQHYKPWQSVQNPIDSIDLQTLSYMCDNRLAIVRMYTYEIGLTPFGKDQTEIFIRNSEATILRLQASSIQRSPIEQARITLVSALRTLYLESGTRYPLYGSPEDIKTRVELLAGISRKLQESTVQVKSDDIYLLVLHIRLLIMQAERRIVTNSKDNVSFSESIQRDIAILAESISREIHDAARRDTLMRLDDTINIALNSSNVNEDKNLVLKDVYNTISSILAENPTSNLLGPDDLRLRLHIARLFTFYLISSNLSPDQEIRTLYVELENSASPEGQTAIDVSLQALRESSKSPMLKYLKEDWVDQILMYYEQLKYKTNKEVPWDHKIIRTMIRVRASNSEDFIAELIRLNELTPEYIVESIKIRIAAIPTVLSTDDKKEATRFILQCERDIDRLKQRRNIIITPVKTPPFDFYSKNAIPFLTEDINRIKNQTGVK